MRFCLPLQTDMAKRRKPKPPGAKIAPDHPFAGIIADAYRVFSGPTPTDTEVCQGCCMDAEIERDFFVPPIEELPLDYLRDWYFAAYRDAGISKTIWAYLLPRVMEVLAVGQDACIYGPEVTLSRYTTASTSPWSAAEWDVIDRFQRAYLDREMRDGSEGLDATLCMFAKSGWALDDLFAQILTCEDCVLVNRLHRAWCRGTPYIWLTAFWSRTQKEEVMAHYTSSVLAKRMETIVLNDDTPPDTMEKALTLMDVIEAYQT